MTIYKTTPDFAVRKTTGGFSGTLTTTASKVAEWDFGDGTGTSVTNSPARTYSGTTPPYLINLIDSSIGYFDNVTGISMTNQQLTAVDISRFKNLDTIDISDNLLLAEDLNLILTTLDANGKTGGTLDYSGNTEVPNSVAARDSYDNLVSKGWSITGEIPLINFVITVKTDNTGTSNDDQFTLPITTASGTYDVLYDGTSSTGLTGSNTITFPSGAGTYEVTIVSNSHVGQVKFNNGGDKSKLLDILQWGSEFEWNSFDNAIQGCDNLGTSGVTAIDAPNMSAVTSMGNSFRGCTGMTYIDMTLWDVSNVTNMTGIFFGCTSLFVVEGAGQWDTGSLTNLNSAFQACSSLESLDCGSWDVSGVTSITSVFNGCSSLITLDLSGWNTSKVTNLTSMFYGCYKLTTVDFSGWNTSKVTSLSTMFQYCTALTTVDVSNFDTSKVTTMQSMFSNCSSLTTVTGIGSLDITSLATASNMFSGVTLNTTGSGGYDELLTGWEAQTKPSGITFSGGNSKYSAGAPATARAALVANGWTITDGGQV